MNSPIRFDNDIPASNQSSGYHWGWAAFLTSLTLVTLALRYAMPIRDGDLWWHMLYGQYFIEHRTLIADHTIFSWTPTTNDSIYCTWLPDIIFYLLHKWKGLPALFVFRYLCLFSIVAGGGIYAKKIGIQRHPLVWLIIIVALLMSYTAAFVKPEVISFALMTFTVWNWYHIRSGGDKAWLNCYVFPVIMLVWVNSHGAYVFGAIFLLLIALGEILNTWFSHGQSLSAHSRRHLGISLSLSAITPFINPYGYHYTVQLLFDLMPTAGNLAYNNKIAAYQSTFAFLTPFQNFELYADLAIVILLGLYARNYLLKKIDWSSLLTNLVFAVLYTKFFRTTFYFAPVFAFSSLYLLGNVPPVTIKRIPWFTKLKAPSVTVIAVVIVGLASYNGYRYPEFYQWTGFGISASNPVSEAAYVKRYFPKARIGNSYDQGSYLLWELWPENRVFFDSRHFPYRSWSDDLFVDFAKGGDIQGFLKKYPCDLWIVSLRDNVPLVYFAQSPDWQLAFYGKSAMVFVRNGLLLPEDVPRVSDDIIDLKNSLNAYTIFTVACSIEDWKTTDLLITAMNERFGNKLMGEWATGFRDAMRFYFNHDYEKALQLFSSIKVGHKDYVNTKVVEATCHQLLASQAWQKKDLVKALNHVHQAWNLSPGNIYSAYNAGLINWYKLKIAHDDSLAGTDGDVSWTYYISYFLANVPNQQNFNEQVAIAQSLLDGKQADDFEQLSLLAPPEPFKRTQ